MALVFFVFFGHHRPVSIEGNARTRNPADWGKLSRDKLRILIPGRRIGPRDYRSACIINAIDLPMMLLLVPFKKDQRH